MLPCFPSPQKAAMPAQQTWVVASHASGAAKDLPQQRRVFLPVLDKHVLQGFSPVQLIEDHGGWKGESTDALSGGVQDLGRGPHSFSILGLQGAGHSGPHTPLVLIGIDLDRGVAGPGEQQYPAVTALLRISAVCCHVAGANPSAHPSAHSAAPVPPLTWGRRGGRPPLLQQGTGGKARAKGVLGVGGQGAQE